MSAKFVTFGKLVARLRAEAGIERQSQLADMLDVKQQTVSRWEAGESRPRAEQVTEIAVLLRGDQTLLLESAGYTSVNTTVSFDRPFPVEALSAESFERFVQMLVELVYAEADVSGYGATGHKQDGLDVLATFPDGRRFSFQCKREAYFGPGKVREAVREHTAHADKKFIVLARIASPQAREEIAKTADWAIWDKEDISRRIRSLAPVEQKRIVRMFFRQHEIALLGESASSPWESLEEFFLAFEDGQLLFNHKWELVGRHAELDELTANLEDAASPVVFLVGSGGSGKSRLLKQTLEDYRKTHTTVRLYFLARDGELTRQSIEDLGEGRILLVVDDAHDRADLHSLFEYASVNRDRVRLVIATRPYGYDRHRTLAIRFSLLDPKTTAVTLKDLKLADAEKLAQQALAASGWTGNTDVAKQIARLTLDCPLATVVAAQVMAAKPRHVLLVGHEDRFRAAIFKQFEAVAAGHVGRPEDATHLSALLRFIALLQPVALNDDETWSAYAAFANLPLHETKRLLDALARAGVLFRRGQTYRLSPDVLADYLIEDRCVAFDGSSTGYAEQVFDIIDDRSKGQLLVNLARLDWRRKNGDVGESRLLDGVWAKLNPSNEPWDLQLDAVADIAFYQPRRCLDFVERKVDEGNITPKLARICKYAAYNMDHLERALELLWDLGRDDTTLQNSNTEHAIRILKELAEPEPKKPLAYVEAVVDFGLQLAKEKDAWSHHASPLDFLSGVLSTEGHETESDRRQMIFRPFFISPEGIRPLRERVLTLIFSLLTNTNPAVGAKAAQALQIAIRFPMGMMGADPGPENRKQWTAEFADTMRQLLALVRANPLHSAVQLELERALAWQAGHGPAVLSKLAHDIIDAFSMTLEARTDRALADGYGMHARLLSRADGEAMWKASLDALTLELIDKFPDKGELVDFIGARLHDLSRGSRLDNGSAYVLVDKLLAADMELCRTIIAEAEKDPEGMIANYAAVALSYLFGADAPVFRELVARFAGSSSEALQAIAANAVGSRVYDQQNTEPGDIAVVRQLLAHNSENITLRALRAIRQLAKNNPEAAKDLVLDLKITSERMADDVAVLFTFQDEIPLDLLSDDELGRLLDKFADLPELDHHWVQALFTSLSRRIPHRVLKFFIARLEAAAGHREDDERFRAVNHGPWLQSRLAFRQTPCARELIMEFMNWWRGASNDVWLLDYSARTAFEAMFAPFDDELVSILDGWLETAQLDDFNYIAAILREADSSFIFRYPTFLLRLFERARQFGVKTKKMVLTELFCSAIAGPRSGTVGEPFPQDLNMKNAAEEALAKCPPNSPLRELYEQVIRYADAEIRRQSEWEDD
ncbi:helix-turn-helix domain-containing protein [Rhizobium ruizarguesonis]